MNNENFEKEIKFPDGFLWGTSTSAYQIEGGITNDWSEWEKSEGRSKKLEKKGKNPKDYICGKACDSYNRYKEDLDLAVSLNSNSIRIGIEWARIQPKKDVWDVEAINHYRDVLQEAKKRNLKTVVTLWHWTNPVWLAREGGWTKKSAVEHYLKYVDLIIENLGGNIDFWVTLNEPMLFANYSYFLGYFPPNKHSFFKFKKATNNLIKAHIKAYEKIHNFFPNANVSITNLSNYFEPARKWFAPEQLFKKIVAYYGINKFFNKINNYIDFIGVDYYRRINLSLIPPFIKRDKDNITDMGWEIFPEGLFYVLKELSKYKKPIYILENGLADESDKKRMQFIKDHLYYVHKAISEGIDVRGYFYWSLLDNFEWDKGWSPKFGLFAVDRDTFERKKRPSADFYAEICRSNSIK
ncbi:MAG: Beta-glucosidase [Candidatus Falkowbacteria bacterium GW2011_GWC2_38_22]|uniref:Beta-glucosidase n=1 Tax=Candidatus Falkowbacteria bacterium GW2011_GWE1_38_31 TaxID=1618638 RepID=A0A0G0M967_9BACT|nr:MAG: Beta-glucosidase [Candidatus Falkowbacteria bacterium GW2011_GWF2_38_1205]KKQ61031.1 MAG: Beta-glucosidase [Candidatus Falkowbacteria bacterium GW2011_GWC2_38_22]KKQ63440.1 MAG: Beta-glucosidase [Candidatus Falkowbacteria bacterium GW2011_GWF1_38_22]KKQ65489.1 MAG: Beta-glucosidase [Candidatus Falkowbacteria bacterium GW2011_GWE2_38_254]KKQ70204.1 MAG: Beta-glucosidase [Candidatus Falkowbacteria bacterium GW2011_GWE1_38_31]KKQ72620.1 MAG: Beta-glucosidase [Candidatus Falkowbacteria bac